MCSEGWLAHHRHSVNESHLYFIGRRALVSEVGQGWVTGKEGALGKTPCPPEPSGWRSIQEEPPPGFLGLCCCPVYPRSAERGWAHLRALLQTPALLDQGRGSAGLLEAGPHLLLHPVLPGKQRRRPPELQPSQCSLATVIMPKPIISWPSTGPQDAQRLERKAVSSA